MLTEGDEAMVYEVWGHTAVGPMCIGTYDSLERAQAKVDYARTARAANGFGGPDSVWMLRDGERCQS